MPKFRYVAKDASGKSVTADEPAASENELTTRLIRRHLTIISVRKLEDSGGPSIFLKKVSTDDLILFCRQLAAMVKGGVPIIIAISTIAEEVKNKYFRDALKDINNSVKGGSSLSSSFKKYPSIFSKLFTSMIESGEKVGSLDSMLIRIGSYMEAQARLKKKIGTALLYPCVIVIFFIAAMLVFTLFLVPKFKAIYAGFNNAKLPVLTQTIFGFSDLIVNNFALIMIAVVIASVMLYRRFFRSEDGRRRLDNLLLNLPVFGSVIKNAALSKMARTLSALLSQGIAISTALDLVGDTSGNSIIKENTVKVKDLILGGDKIQEAMKKVKIFPPIFVQMTAVGVESGSLPELLETIANFYEERVDAFVTNLTSLIEPVLLGVLGIGVGFVIVALYLPIFKMSQAMTGQ